MKLYLPLSLAFIWAACSGAFAQNQHFPLDFQHAAELTNKDSLENYIVEKYETDRDNLLGRGYTTREKDIMRTNFRARKAVSLAMIADSQLLLTGVLYEYVGMVFDKLLTANPGIQSGKRILIVCDLSPNAFTMGDGIVYVHIGLLYRLQNEEQLALVLGHELAHNELDHYSRNLLDYVALMTDRERESQIKKIMRDEYGQASKMNELMIPWILANREKSRKFESAADSLGFEFYANAGYSTELAVGLFDLLESFDHERDTQLIDWYNVVKTDSVQLDSLRFTKYSQQSSLGTFEEKNAEEKELEALLRTHPFEEERAFFFRDQMNLLAQKPADSISAGYAYIRYISEGEMVYTALRNKNIGRALFYAENMQQAYPADRYSKNVFAYALAALALAKKNRQEGMAIDMRDKDFDEAYDRTLHFFRLLKPAECARLAYFFLEKNCKDDTEFVENMAAQVISTYLMSQTSEFLRTYNEYKDYLLKSEYQAQIRKIYDEYLFKQNNPKSK
jgi:predicted Zn-dependent protease